MTTINEELHKQARIDHIKGVNGSRATVATLLHEGQMYAGVAYVHPNDNFSRYLGRVKAVGHLAQVLTGTKKPNHFKYFVLPAEDERAAADARDVILDDVVIALT